MSANLPNGSIVSIASTYDTAIVTTGISNANPGVVSAAAHGLADGAIVEVRSGWSRLDQRIARVDNAATGTFDLEGINTTSTSVYPAGAGGGTVREVTAWTEIAQIINSTTSGGEQQFTQFGYLSELDDRQLPTTRSPETLTFDVADDDSLAHWDVLVAADEDRSPRAIRIVLPSGAIIYRNAIVTFRQSPTLTRNEVMAVQVTLSPQARLTRYAA